MSEQLSGVEMVSHTCSATRRADALAARLAAVESVLTRMECRSVDHRHPNEAGHWGVEGRAYYYAGDVIDDIYELRAAIAADPPTPPDRRPSNG